MRSGAILTASASASTNFWGSPRTSNRSSPRKGRTPPGLLVFRSSNPALSVFTALSALPGAGKVLKSPVVAKTLQSVYHRFNTKAHKYEPLSREERLKWEEYYAADQEELSELLNALQVVE